MNMLVRVALCFAVVSAFAAEARADKDEASLHVQAVGGLASMGDAASSETSSAPLGGVGARFGYGLADWYQLDASLTAAATGAASFSSGTFHPPGLMPISGPFSVTQQLVRLDAGITLRFGVRFIPTLRLAIGADGRRTSSPSGQGALAGFSSQLRGPSFGADLVGAGSVGFDLRLSRRTIIGLAVGASYAVPLGGASFRSFDATLFWSHYWYPRWR